MDDDVDIYGDLPSFDVNECATCKERAKEFTEKYAKLEEEILSWKSKCENFEQEKKIILTNTSSLMKTARAEIDRKDRTIIELRRELEDVKFRRGVWSQSKTNHQRNHHELRERRPQKQTKIYEKELSPKKVQTHLANDEPAAWPVCDEDEQDPEQKWDPACENFTVYGERLRKKLLQEQEAERIRKEEAKNVESKNSTPCSNGAEKPADPKDGDNIHNDINVEVETQRGGESKPISSDGTLLVKLQEERLGAIESSDKPEYQTDEHHEKLSEEGELSESSDVQSGNGDHHWEPRRDDRYDEFPNRRLDNDRRDDSKNRNSYLNSDWRYNFAHKSRKRSPDSRASGYSDHKSRRHGEVNPTRQNHDLRSNSNYRSRSRTETYRDHGDRYEKRREDRLTRENYNYSDYNIKENHDLRDRFERKYDDRSFHDCRSDHDRNYDSDHKRPRRSRSPGEISRSKSSSSRSSQNDWRRNERSKSRGRSNTENKITSGKNRTDDKRKSRDRKIVSEERANHDSQTIQPVSESSTRNPMEMVKSKILEDSEITNHQESREKSKTTSSHHGDGRATDKSKSHEPLESGNKREPKTDSNEKKGGHSNREIASRERDKDDSKKTKPISESLRKNSVEDSKNTIPENSKLTDLDETREKAICNPEKRNPSSGKIVNPVDTPDKFILMLENDSEVTLSPITRREIESIGSRSFREEKIENIEKFIQDYEDNVTHCSLLGNDVCPEQEEENKFANSTSSIVDTLSMDVDDLEKELNEKMPKKSEYSEESEIDQKSKEKTLETELKVDAINKRDENVMIISKIEKNRTTKKPEEVSLDKNSNETAINEKLGKPVDTEGGKSLSVGKTLEASAVEKKNVEVVDEKKKQMATNKSEGRDKKLEGMSIDKKTKKNPSKNKSHDTVSDGKSLEEIQEICQNKSKKVHKKLKKVDGDKKLKRSESIDRLTKNKTNKEKSNLPQMETKSEDTKILEKTEIPEKRDETTIKNKSEIISSDKKSKNVSLIKPCDKGDDKKLKNIVPDSVSSNRVIDASSGTVKLDKESETVKDKEPEKPICESSAPVPSTPQLPFVPPLPPSPQLPSLPPLPPSPPPEEKEPEISVAQKVSPTKAEAKKSQPEKVISKQTKNRPRIPCLPIVSLYSRKRRGMVLTDSTSSQTIITSSKSSQALEEAGESSVPQKAPETGSKTVLTPITTVEPSELNKIQSENPPNESITPETKEKPEKTKVINDRNTSESKNDNKIITEAENCSLDREKPEVNSPATVATSNEGTKSIQVSATDSSLETKNIVDEIAKDVEDKAGEIQVEIETTENYDNIPTSCTSSKSSERAKRPVLKTIASTTGSTESGSSNRKRPLSKEKENQSKPPKQAKIMIIARRRPVQLQDSSTVTTLVPSVHEVSSNDNKIQSSRKNVTPGRKRRIAES